jgi:hypothetical protein
MLLMSMMRDIIPTENARQVTAVRVTTRNLGVMVIRYGRSCASPGVELDPTDDVSDVESDPVDPECGRLVLGLGPAFDSWAGGGDISPAVDALATINL